MRDSIRCLSYRSDFQLSKLLLSWNYISLAASEVEAHATRRHFDAPVFAWFCRRQRPGRSISDYVLCANIASDGVGLREQIFGSVGNDYSPAAVFSNLCQFLLCLFRGTLVFFLFAAHRHVRIDRSNFENGSTRSTRRQCWVAVCYWVAGRIAVALHTVAAPNYLVSCLQRAAGQGCVADDVHSHLDRVQLFYCF